MVAARLGVLGGTFDPPHVGHMVAAINVAHQLALERVLFMVANDPWQKSASRSISPAADRFAMVEQATAHRDHFVASPLEIQRGGESVTADTLEDLATRYPDTEFTVILGSDAAAGLDTWRRTDDLMTLATFAVVDRPGTTGARPPSGFKYDVVACPLMDISSTDIRQRQHDKLPIDYLVADSVRDYIAARGLYA